MATGRQGLSILDRADDKGNFTIPNIRPGTYTLHAIANGVLGEFSKLDVIVAAGKKVELGDIQWKPVRYGKQLWEIGVPNRSAENSGTAINIGYGACTMSTQGVSQ